MPNKERNPNRIRRQPTPDSPPPREAGAREAPGDTTDWVEVGHEETQPQRPLDRLLLRLALARVLVDGAILVASSCSTRRARAAASSGRCGSKSATRRAARRPPGAG